MTIIRDVSAPLAGTLRYRTAEHSFSFDVAVPDDVVARAGGQAVASAAVGTLQIEFGVRSRRALFVWGYHPRPAWQAGQLEPPVAEPGAVVLSPGIPLERGISVPLARVGEWLTTIDVASGWVRASRDRKPDEEVALVADGVVIGELKGRIHSLWLHPVFE
ncbi:MAG: hypothetical protein IRY85_20515 [Micromonosporaceae bacterium]|nr:hypothetical protein [Micromonosporaceae bacterium]